MKIWKLTFEGDDDPVDIGYFKTEEGAVEKKKTFAHVLVTLGLGKDGDFTIEEIEVK